MDRGDFNINLPVIPADDGYLVVGKPQDFEDVRQKQRQETKRQRKFLTMHALADYIKRWGTPANTTVFTSPSAIKAVLDETDGLVTLDYSAVRSVAFQAWEGLLGRRIAVYEGTL